MHDLVLRRGDDAYPDVFEELRAPPPQLFVRGALDWSAPRVAVVGTRRPSERGRRLATELGRGLAAAGVTVVSGGALGVDGCAHRGALEAGGVTWVVLPSPLARPAPHAHRGLFRRVLEGGGAWLSELEREIGRPAFCARNRLVAALGQVVVVVEAKLESGTRHTVDAARGLGRPTAAYPWAVGDPYGAGCLAWLKSGAHLVTGPTDVLDLLGAERPRRCAVSSEDPLIAALGPDGARADEISITLGWPLERVLGALGAAEIEGRVRAEPGGRFVGVAVVDR